MGRVQRFRDVVGSEAKKQSAVNSGLLLGVRGGGGDSTITEYHFYFMGTTYMCSLCGVLKSLLRTVQF